MKKVYKDYPINNSPDCQKGDLRLPLIGCKQSGAFYLGGHMNLPPDIEPPETEHRAMLIIIIAMCLGLFLFGSCIKKARAEEITQASWYSAASCKREGTWKKYGGQMANGEVFADEKMVCASWDFPFKTILKVTNLVNGKTVIVEVSDRGPSKKLYKKGRKLDLSQGAFAKIANLKSGVIQVAIEQIKKVRGK